MKHMRIMIAGLMVAGLALAGCSQETQDAAASAAENAVSDTASNLSVASSEVRGAADDIGDDDSDATNAPSTTTSADGATTTTTTTTNTD
jgi:hypothetical protein